MKLIQITYAALSATVASPAAVRRHRMLQAQFTYECLADTAAILKNFNVQRHSYMKKCPKSETWVGNTPFIDYRPCHPSFGNHLKDMCVAAGGTIIWGFEPLYKNCQNVNTGEWNTVGTNGYFYECFANSCYALTWHPIFYYDFFHVMQSSGYHMHIYDCDTNIMNTPETPSTPPVITEENSDDGPPIPPEAVTEGPSIPPGETVTGPIENSDDGLRGGEVTDTKEYSDDGNGGEVTGTEEDSDGSIVGTPTFIIVLAATSLVAVLAGIRICTCRRVTIFENHNHLHGLPWWSRPRQMQEEG